MGIFRQFPYSNFHEMNMDEIIKIMREMQDEWEATKDEWASCKDFIDNYFETLNLDEETERALRRLINEGTLSDVINPVIIAQTTAWLAEHITPTTPAVDSSLTIEGAAADAKVVGDLYRNSSELLDFTARNIWTTGKFWYIKTDNTIGQSNYAQTSAANRIRVAKGDKYRIMTRGTGTSYSYLITNESGYVLEHGAAALYDAVLKITQDTAFYLYLNNLNTNTDPYCYMIRTADELEWDAEYITALQKGIKVNAPIAVENSAIYDNTGYYGVVSSTGQMASPDYIRLHKNLTYKVMTIKPKLMFNLYFYDENMNFIEAYDTNSNMKFYQITFNNTKYSYMRIGCYLANIQASDFNLFNIYGFSSNKKISFVGDSITSGVSSKMLYHMYLGHKYGWNCLNYGVGGIGFVGTVTGSVVVGNGVEGVGKTEQATGNNNILDLVATIPTDSDGVVVFGGTNDYGGNRPMSEFEANVTGTINYLQTNMPECELLFLTPSRRYTNGHDGETPNTEGLKLSDYCNKIKEICALKGVNCIDLYNTSGLNPSNTAQIAALMPGGLHPNEKGHKFIYKTIKGVCDSTFNN